MTLSRKHWDRLKAEIAEAKMGWTELWLGASFAFLGVAAGAWIAILALPEAPSSDSNATQLSARAHDTLLVVGIFSVVLAFACFLSWLGKRRDHNANLEQVLKNMKSHEHDS